MTSLKDPDNRDDMIRELGQTPTTLMELCGELSDEAMDFSPSKDEWSIREILAHLVDDEMYVMRTRMERMIKEDAPSLAPHDEKQWYASRNTNRDALHELLDDFQLQRSASIRMLAMLRETDWQRTGYQPEYGTFTAARWLWLWLDHDRTHLRQIQASLAKYREGEHR